MKFYVSIGLGYHQTPHPVFFMTPDDLIEIEALTEDRARDKLVHALGEGMGGRWSSIYDEDQLPRVAHHFPGVIIPLAQASHSRR